MGNKLTKSDSGTKDGSSRRMNQMIPRLRRSSAKSEKESKDKSKRPGTVSPDQPSSLVQRPLFRGSKRDSLRDSDFDASGVRRMSKEEANSFQLEAFPRLFDDPNVKSGMKGGGGHVGLQLSEKEMAMIHKQHLAALDQDTVGDEEKLAPVKEVPDTDDLRL